MMRKPTMDELFEEYGAVPLDAARRWSNGSNLQDCIQQGRLALIEASDKADWSRIEHRNQFIAFAHTYIRRSLGAMSASVEFATSGSRQSMNRVGFHSRATLDALHYLPEGDGVVEDVESWDAVMDAMDTLTARQRRIIGLYYLDGILDDGKVANVLEITRQNVNKTRLLAEKRIREYLEQDE